MRVELTNHSFGFYWFVIFGVILVRYFFLAGGTHLFFYSVLRKSFAQEKLHRSLNSWISIRRDVKLSVLSAVVFSLCAAFIISEYDLGVTLLYTDLSEYGVWYLGCSYFAVLILQDAYFYFTHRLFHRRLIFPWLHQGHHRSGHTTPWTSFAFDPPEALVQALFLVGIVFLIPLHFITLVAVLITMTVWAVLNHLELDLFPPSFPHHWFGRWFIGPAHHSIHHRKYTMHYGLYFTLWDKLLGTNDPNYQIKNLTIN